MRFWLGGYTADMDGAATGIGMLLAGAADDALAGGSLGFAGDVASASGSPSWLAAASDPRRSLRGPRGRRGRFRPSAAPARRPSSRSAPPSTRASPSATSPWLPTARGSSSSCWGDGRVVRMALDAAGRPSSPVISPAIRDPHGPGDVRCRGALRLPAAPDLDLAAAGARAARSRGRRVRAPHARTTIARRTPQRLPRATPSRAPRTRTRPSSSRADSSRRPTWGSTSCASGGRGATGLVPVQQVVLPRGSGPRHTRLAPERAPLRRHRALARGLRPRPAAVPAAPGAS